MHLIGKEIVRFHCVYWPAFLMAAGLPLPKTIFAHGWLLFEENKMSKSRGNIVRAETILDVLGADALRYFLLREIVFGQDGTFSFDALVQRYNSDLANGLGNLASRTLTMITRYFKGEVPYPSALRRAPRPMMRSPRLRAETIARIQRSCSTSTSSRARWKWRGDWSARSTSTSSKTSPGRCGEKQDEESRSRLATMLYTAAEALRIVTALAHPVIPESTAKIWTATGAGRHRQVRSRPARSGDSFSWERSWARLSRCFRAPTRARSKGCRRWNRNGTRRVRPRPKISRTTRSGNPPVQEPSLYSRPCKPLRHTRTATLPPHLRHLTSASATTEP